ncbi:MAG: ribonuclease Z [Lachnospiraceae bacterium]|nr:ribonuclease Z [Lachnospiraceae bacterium]
MLDVCLLGTGGMLPLPYRWLTSLMMRFEGSNILIDCGEGTQIAMKEKGWSPNPIDVICFTHYHADHISGLPGLLLSIGNSERTEPITMIGPKGLARVVNALRTIAPELPFDIKYLEIEEPRQIFEFDGYNIEAFKVSHNVTCYGYTLTIPRIGRFDADRARELAIPLPYWNRLQKGETITDETGTYTPDMVIGPARRGLKVTYCTDSRPVPVISEMASGADLFICEGMYGEPGMEEKARQHRHMTFYEAADLAVKADPQPKEMWLTHYSPALSYPKEYEKEVRKIFKNTHTAKDGRSVSLMFED